MEKLQALASLKAFLTNDQAVGTIIELCDLYPVGDSWRKWTDHLGNFIQVHNNKKVVSFTNNPLGHDETIVTDLYLKAHPKKLSAISEWAFVSFGKGEKSFYDTLYVWFLGRDNRLRLSPFHNGEWMKNEPPLISGVDTLRPIVNRIGVKGYSQADILYIKGPIATNITRSWATEWPPSNELLDEMRTLNKKLSSVVETII